MESRVAVDCGGGCGVGPCCSGRGPVWCVGHVYGWRLAWVRAVVSCVGLGRRPPCPLWFGTLGDHPVGVCDAVSSAGRFWPARLLSSRLGGGELSGATGMGRGAVVRLFYFSFCVEEKPRSVIVGSSPTVGTVHARQ